MLAGPRKRHRHAAMLRLKVKKCGRNPDSFRRDLVFMNDRLDPGLLNSLDDYFSERSSATFRLTLQPPS